MELEQRVPEQMDSVVAELFANADRRFLDSVVDRTEGQFLRNPASSPDVSKTRNLWMMEFSTLKRCGP